MGNSSSHDYKNLTKNVAEEIYNENGSWKMEKRDRSIDPEKVSKFIETVDDEQKLELIKKVIDLTRYILFSEFYGSLEKCILELCEKYKKFNIYLPSGKNKVGSEHWIMILMWGYLRGQIQKIIHTCHDIDNDLPIIFIDDCIYSGHSLLASVDNIQHDYKKSHNKKLPNKVVIMVPYASTGGLYEMQNLHAWVKGWEYIIGEMIVSPFLKGKMHVPNLYDILGCETNSVIPVYFDHKIANKHGSFPQIYGNIVREKPSRYMIEKLARLLEKPQSDQNIKTNI